VLSQDIPDEVIELVSAVIPDLMAEKTGADTDPQFSSLSLFRLHGSVSGQASRVRHPGHIQAGMVFEGETGLISLWTESTRSRRLNGFARVVTRSIYPATLRYLSLFDDATAGDGDHWYIRIGLTQFQNGFQSVLHRHDQIGNDQIERLFSKYLDPFLAISGFDDFITLDFQNLPEDIKGCFFIIDNQYSLHDLPFE